MKIPKKWITKNKSQLLYQRSSYWHYGLGGSWVFYHKYNFRFFSLNFRDRHKKPALVQCMTKKFWSQNQAWVNKPAQAYGTWFGYVTLTNDWGRALAHSFTIVLRVNKVFYLTLCEFPLLEQPAIGHWKQIP